MHAEALIDRVLERSVALGDANVGQRVTAAPAGLAD